MIHHRGTKKERDKGTKEQRDKGIEENVFSALCLCHFVPLSLKLSASDDSGRLFHVPEC